MMVSVSRDRFVHIGPSSGGMRGCSLVCYHNTARSPAVRAALLWEPRDLWIGVYWTSKPAGHGKIIDVYVCVVPCLPIRLTFGSYR